jgi:hypothetical protein
MKLRNIPKKIKAFFSNHTMEFKAIPKDLESFYSQYDKDGDNLRVSFAEKVSTNNYSKGSKRQLVEDSEVNREILNNAKVDFVRKYDKYNEKSRLSLLKKATIAGVVGLASAITAIYIMPFSIFTVIPLTVAAVATSKAMDYNNDIDKLHKATYFIENSDTINEFAGFRKNMNYKLIKKNKYFKKVFETIKEDGELNINNIRKINLDVLKNLKKEYELISRIATYSLEKDIIDEPVMNNGVIKDASVLIKR